MQPHQQRVIEEKFELDKKLASLNSFIKSSGLFRDMSEPEQQILRDQAEVMTVYSDILTVRIGSFK